MTAGIWKRVGGGACCDSLRGHLGVVEEAFSACGRTNTRAISGWPCLAASDFFWGIGGADRNQLNTFGISFSFTIHLDIFGFSFLSVGHVSICLYFERTSSVHPSYPATHPGLAYVHGLERYSHMFVVVQKSGQRAKCQCGS